MSGNTIETSWVGLVKMSYQEVCFEKSIENDFSWILDAFDEFKSTNILYTEGLH